MKPVHCLSAQATPETIAKVRETNPDLAALLQTPFGQNFRTKRAADKWQAEWTAAGYVVTRTTKYRAESPEELLMVLIGAQKVAA